MTRTQFYRLDKAGLKTGQFRLTILINTGGVIERKDGTPTELHMYRAKHYPNAHNWRAHFDECSSPSECPVCQDRLQAVKDSVASRGSASQPPA